MALAIVFTTRVVARPPDPPGDVSLNDPTATLIDKTTGTYRIDATGKLTLGKNDTWDGFAIEFKDSNGSTPAPTLVTFKQPAPGTSETFHYRLYTTTNGKWTIKATLNFKTGNPPIPDTKIAIKTVTLP